MKDFSLIFAAVAVTSLCLIAAIASMWRDQPVQAAILIVLALIVAIPARIFCQRKLDDLHKQ